MRTLLWTLTVSLLALGPAGAEEAPQSTLEKVVKRGVLRVGLESGYMPFEMKDKSGKVIGFDVDMAMHMAEAMGVELRLVETPWEEVIPALLADKFDIIMSGMTITPQRNLRVSFAEPYLVVGQTILLRKALEGKIASYKDLNDAQYTLATKQGVTAEHAIQKYMPKAKLQLYPTEADAVAAVVTGKVDAFVYDLPFNAIHYSQRRNQLAFLDTPFTYEPLGWAIRKGDPDFLNWLNNFLAQAKGDGTYDDLYRKWVRNTQWIQDLK